MMKRVLTTCCLLAAALTANAEPVAMNRQDQLKVTITSPSNDPEIACEWSKMTKILEQHKVSPGLCMASLSAAYFWAGTNAPVAHTLVTNAVAKGTIDAKRLNLRIEFKKGESPTTSTLSPEAAPSAAPSG